MTLSQLKSNEANLEKATVLYRHFSADGVLLYVGISGRVWVRNDEHLWLSGWFSEVSQITLERFSTRAEAVEAEREAILNEKPRFNVQHNRPKRKLGKSSSGKPNLYEISRAEIARTVLLQPLYSPIEAAKFLGISGRMLRVAMATGDLGFVEIQRSEGGKSTRFISGWQLIDWLENLSMSGQNEEVSDASHG